MARTVVSVAMAVAATLVLATGADAQVTASLQGGIIHSTLVGSDASNVNAHTGLYAGGSVTAPLRAGFALRVGAALIQRGAEFDLAGTSGSGAARSTNLSLDLLQLQLLGVYGILTDRRVSPHVFGGVTPSFRVACDYSVTGVYQGSCDEGVRLRGTDFEAMGGAGVTVGYGRGAVALDVTFQQGLSSIYRGDLGVKTRAITFTAGAEFPLLP
jgi:hypothetical protein